MPTGALDFAGRRSKWRELDAELAKRTSNDFEPAEAVVFSTYGCNTADALVTPRQNMSPPRPQNEYSFLARSHVWDTLFVDEVSEVRNPESDMAIALRRLVERCCVVIGASATPIYSSVLDLVNIGRVLGLPSIVERNAHDPRHASFMEIYTEANGVKLVRGERRFDYQGCTADIRALMERAAGHLATLKRLRKELHALRSDRSPTYPDGDAVQDSRVLREMGISVPVQWNDVVTAEDAEEEPICGKIDAVKQQFAKDVIAPLRKRMGNVMVRRCHTSVGHDGLPLTDIQAVVPQLVKIVMGEKQRAAYEDRMASASHRDRQFYVNMRRFLKHAQVATVGYTSYFSAPSAALVALGQRLREWLKAQEREPDVTKQEKAVVHIIWTSLLPYIQAYLHSQGIPTAALTGQHSAVRREEICEAFDLDASHPADLTTSLCSDSTAVKVLPTTSRILIMSDVGQAGINLQRANVVHLFDPSWAYADVQQIIGRVNRIGQRRPVSAYLYYHEDTFEMSFFDLVKHKQEASSDFFMGGQAVIPIPQHEIATARPDSDNINDPATRDPSPSMSVAVGASDIRPPSANSARDKQIILLCEPLVPIDFEPASPIVPVPSSIGRKNQAVQTFLGVEDNEKVINALHNIATELVTDPSTGDLPQLTHMSRWGVIQRDLLRHKCHLLAERLRASPADDPAADTDRRIIWSWINSESTWCGC